MSVYERREKLEGPHMQKCPVTWVTEQKDRFELAKSAGEARRVVPAFLRVAGEEGAAEVRYKRE